MQPGNSLRRRAGLHASAVLALACALLPAPAAAAPSRPAAGDLSARLAELAAPGVRAASPARQAEELDLPEEGPGSLLRDGNRVLVEVRFEHDVAAAVKGLRAAGAKIADVSRRYGTVTVAARPDQLRALSTVPGVNSATEVLAPLLHQTSGSGPVTSATTPCFGAATSEGDTQLRAAQARAEFEVDGSGVEVGVLSDSFDRDTEAATSAAADVASGDLPGPGNPCGHAAPVSILDDSQEGSDEGRAMAQIVHDLAPGAELSFATAFSGLTAFAGSVEALAAAGADVIVDDVSYFEEPFFQEGPVGVAVSNVTAGGVSYFSSAGNNNLISGGKDIASWEAPEYRDSLDCPAALVTLSEELEAEFGPAGGLNPAHCLDFDPGAGIDRTFRITVSSGATLNIDLQWAEPWEGVDTDIDAFLFDSEGNLLAESFDDNSSVLGTQRPFEFIGWENETGGPAQVELVINRYSGESPRLKFALLQNGGGVTSTEYQESAGGDVVGPTIFGHNGAEDAVSLGAIRYDRLDEPERFSSRGPVTHYFGPVNGAVPAAPLGAPAVLAKPDVVASDGGANTFFGSFSSGAFRFFGTSAAAPHAAAVDALLRDADDTLDPADARTAFVTSARPIGTFGPAAIGAGLIDAFAALDQIVEPVEASGPGPQESPATGASPLPTTAGTGTERVLRTFFRRRPPRVVRTRGRGRGRVARVVFRFGSNEASVTFLCRLDRRRWRVCGARFVRRLRIGRHVLRVKARDAAGNVDRTPAVHRFRVKRGPAKKSAAKHRRGHRRPQR